MKGVEGNLAGVWRNIKQLRESVGGVYMNGEKQLEIEKAKNALRQKVRVSGVERTVSIYRALRSDVHIVVEKAPDLDHITMSGVMHIDRKNGLKIDFAGAELRVSSFKGGYAIRIIGCTDVVIKNLKLTFVDLPSGKTDIGVMKQSGILIKDCKRVTIVNSEIIGAPRGGIVIKNSTNCMISNTKFSHFGNGGVVIQGASRSNIVTKCSFHHGIGFSIYDAAVLITNRLVNEKIDLSDIHNPEIPTPTVLGSDAAVPSENVIIGNQISDMYSIGIFLENGRVNLIEKNTVSNCSKEGISLGGKAPIGNVLTQNTVEKCGNRWSQSSYIDELLKDVPDQRVDATGHSVYKLPGIGISKGSYNILLGNRISDNFGGGIKLLRESYFNYLTGNIVADCNKGANDLFQFPGISLMADPDGTQTPKGTSFNVVSHNTITGLHSVGTLLAKGSICNTFYRNVVEFKFFALESASPDQLNFEGASTFRRLEGGGPDVLKAHLKRLPYWGVKKTRAG
eukprot:TRINITY_DN24878_c0_g1_i1.p1 TRINITY_DN24878_c0_g1~~TRINITY_DN24878_c0_g1_i1.p1  ORF type:complete len:565 (+),score=41.62 TRINITY_DN24878_c0_g1_i1:171-1697(+)